MRGFTLIELSVVLVIIGLLVGGILVGRDLIQESGNKKFMSEVEALRTATQTFKVKYDAYPGDMVNAYDYFGSACATTASNCNGDGNGLYTTPGDWPTTGTANSEQYNFYLHLRLAGFGYAGTGWEYGSQPNFIMGKDFPEFKGINGKATGLWMTSYTNAWPHNKHKGLNGLAATGGKSGGQSVYRLTPGAQAYIFDLKYDDGIANSGLIQGFITTSGCSASYTTYLQNETTASDNAPRNGCQMSFSAGF